MDIGTAKPTPDERRQVPFHGVDVVDPDADWTLADYQRLGEAACEEIAARGSTPLIVGGTGLYVRALTTRLDIPHTPPDEAFRDRWRRTAQERGCEFVRNELALVDLPSAGRIHVNDLGRLIRALEVFESTGVPLSEWHARNRAHSERQDVQLFGLNFGDRRLLYTRIDARVDQMLADGFLDEVRGLLAAGYGRALKPMQSLGYRQFAAHLTGELDRQGAVAQTKQETRHFARRQLIWFRADKRIRWLEAAGRPPDALAEEIAALLKETHTHEGDKAADEQASE